jgi:hypothetical protein
MAVSGVGPRASIACLCNIWIGPVHCWASGSTDTALLWVHALLAMRRRWKPSEETQRGRRKSTGAPPKESTYDYNTRTRVSPACGFRMPPGARRRSRLLERTDAGARPEQSPVSDATRTHPESRLRLFWGQSLIKPVQSTRWRHVCLGMVHRFAQLAQIA